MNISMYKGYSLYTDHYLVIITFRYGRTPWKKEMDKGRMLPNEKVFKTYLLEENIHNVHNQNLEKQRADINC